MQARQPNNENATQPCRVAHSVCVEPHGTNEDPARPSSQTRIIRLLFWLWKVRSMIVLLHHCVDNNKPTSRGVRSVSYGRYGSRCCLLVGLEARSNSAPLRLMISYDDDEEDLGTMVRRSQGSGGNA